MPDIDNAKQLIKLIIWAYRNNQREIANKEILIRTGELCELLEQIELWEKSAEVKEPQSSEPKECEWAITFEETLGNERVFYKSGCGNHFTARYKYCQGCGKLIKIKDVK